MNEEEISGALSSMLSDRKLITKTAYRANKELWPNNRISFVDNHLAYLKAHPMVDPKHYISNLRLMLRRKP